MRPAESAPALVVRVGPWHACFYPLCNFCSPLSASSHLDEKEFAKCMKEQKLGLEPAEVKVTPLHAHWSTRNGRWLATRSTATCGGMLGNHFFLISLR